MKIVGLAGGQDGAGGGGGDADPRCAGAGRQGRLRGAGRR
jgi:hypothetical protein